MGRIVVSEFVTLDGVFEDPGGSEGKPYGGWQTSLMGDDEEAYKLEELRTAGALLLGRVTYEAFAAAWPTMPDADVFSELMNSLPKHVVTLTRSTFNWNNSYALDPNLMAAVQKLKETTEKDVLVYGSGTLVRSLLDYDLVDELRLMTYPIVLGTGQQLLKGAPRKQLQFTGERTFKNGTVLLTYSQTPEGAAPDNI